MKQNRPLIARTGHTRNQEVNLSSIAIVLAGNFDEEYMTSEQLDATHKLIKRLDAMYHFEKIIPHREASATACPGKNLIFQLGMFWRGDHEEHKEPTVEGDIWNISRYYTPVPGQSHYYRKTYEEDFAVNCQGDCFITADGTDLRSKQPMTVAACPSTMPFGTRLEIEGIGIVTCHDRGGAIKGKRIDVWAGSGSNAVDLIRSTKGGPRKVRIL